MRARSWVWGFSTPRPRGPRARTRKATPRAKAPRHTRRGAQIDTNARVAGPQHRGTQTTREPPRPPRPDHPAEAPTLTPGDSDTDLDLVDPFAEDASAAPAKPPRPRRPHLPVTRSIRR